MRLELIPLGEHNECVSSINLEADIFEHHAIENAALIEEEGKLHFRVMEPGYACV